ncbi:MAG: hypothetical protein II463_05030 [Bacteroidaceae bacterium]|nr:hypothetical protein [Bacteroidaceae bacterium]
MKRLNIQHYADCTASVRQIIERQAKEIAALRWENARLRELLKESV